MYTDEIFKHYAGKNVERNIPLIIGQHGGNYGLVKWSFHEYHELSICNKYISWGWKEGLIKSAKIHSLGQISSIKKPSSKSKKTKLLLVTSASYLIMLMLR